jgi:restriction system protein
MSRSFVNTMAKIARDAVREQQRLIKEQERVAREMERSQRARARACIADAREQKRLYQEDRVADVAELNAELESRLAHLGHLLVKGIKLAKPIDFESLKTTPDLPTLDLSSLSKPEPERDWEGYRPDRPHVLLRWLPPIRRGYETRVAVARKLFEEDCQRRNEREGARLEGIAQKEEQHRSTVQSLQAEADAHNSKIDLWKVALQRGAGEAVQDYATLVLEQASRPAGFPHKFKVAYSAASKQLVAEFELPEMGAIVPTCKTYSYVRANDKITESALPDKQRRSLYSSVVAQDTLLRLHEIFRSERHDLIESIVLNGFVDTIDPGTGQRIRPCIVTVRTTRDVFGGLNLANVEPIAALHTLNASFSKSPAELAPVRPLLEFSMVDPRYIKEQDVLSSLDQRPNLMALNPSEFESLITNLFQKMGLETKLTQASRDGGVDCVAYDSRPIFGGKIVIQAKRYKHTVGVSAVRDLYGTMQNEGASKGILVTTSGYGKAAFDFISGKPMELLDGGNLLYLLKTHADIDARIVVPEDWHDPVPDGPG